MGWRAQVAAAVLGAGSVTAIPALGAGCDTPAGRLAVAARTVGVPDDQVVTAVAVGLAESGGRPDAVNDQNWDGSVDRGAWQINSVHARFDPGRLLELGYNAEAMFDVSGGGVNWEPWVAFTSGAWLDHLGAAQAVAGCAVVDGDPVDGRLSLFELVDKAGTEVLYRTADRVCAAGVDCAGWRAYTGSSSSSPPARPASARADGLDPEFGTALDRLIADAPGPITVVSGLRTAAEQKVLYDAYLSGAGNLAAWSDGVSCASDHCAGTAADLGFASFAVEEWAHRNAERYGLVFGVPGEPWHVSL